MACHSVILNPKTTLLKTLASLGLDKGTVSICLGLCFKAEQLEAGYPGFLRPLKGQKGTNIQIGPVAVKFKEMCLDIRPLSPSSDDSRAQSL